MVPSAQVLYVLRLLVLKSKVVVLGVRSAQYSIGLSYSSHVFFLWDSLYGVGSERNETLDVHSTGQFARLLTVDVMCVYLFRNDGRSS